MPSASVRPLRVAALPFSLACSSGDAVAIADRLSEAAHDGVSLAVFPEMSLLGDARVDRLRRAELEALAQPLDGPAIGAVAHAVEQTGVATGAGWLERANDGALYNSYVVCMPGGARHVHRKVYATESPHLQSGAQFDVFDTPWGVRLSILIGADNYMPENARVAALKGATLLLAPHRSGLGSAGAGASPHADWFARALSARAADNGMFAVLSDSQAEGRGRCKPGVALIADPCGALIAASAPPRRPIAAASIDPEHARQSVARRWLAARRPELYATLIASQAQSEAQPPLHERDDASPWTYPERAVTARGSVAVSFAVVGRRRR
jgi:predicted amidohydrolase